MYSILKQETTKTLAGRLRDFEFHPEVYTYPAPRMYRALEHFCSNDADFTDEINVYVHIPFCKQICSFCGYFKTVDDDALRADYVDALVEEIGLYGEIFKDRIIRTLHFGGGTPSLLSAGELEKIVRALSGVYPQLLHTCREISLEATPESVEAVKFKQYREAGLNRVSLGVQSLNSSEIRLACRRNPAKISAGAIARLRAAGIRNVVIDLMIGIEGQSVESFKDSLRQCLDLRPETVQLYALGLMPHTGLGKRKQLTLMSNEQLYQCYEEGRALIMARDYRHVHNNRYSLLESESYLQEDNVYRGMSLLGLGAGARSYAKNVHYRNTYASADGRKAIAEYMRNIRAGSHSVQSGIFLSEDELIRQYAIRNIQSLDRADFYHKFGVCFKDRFGQLYEEMTACGLVQEDGAKLKLTTRGLLFRDLIVKQFFSAEALKLEKSYRSQR